MSAAFVLGPYDDVLPEASVDLGIAWGMTKSSTQTANPQATAPHWTQIGDSGERYAALRASSAEYWVAADAKRERRRRLLRPWLWFRA